MFNTFFQVEARNFLGGEDPSAPPPLVTGLNTNARI